MEFNSFIGWNTLRAVIGLRGLLRSLEFEEVVTKPRIELNSHAVKFLAPLPGNGVIDCEN